MNKKPLFFLVLAVIMITSSVVYILNNKTAKLSKTEINTAINQASYFYKQKQQRGESLDDGPCISNALMPGWVADLVHNPRSAIDDLPQNQCSTYLNGQVVHIVELDLDGNFVRVK